MTIQHERMGEDQAEQGDDRREPTTRTRISWAAERPYVVPAAVEQAHNVTLVPGRQGAQEGNLIGGALDPA